MSDISWATRTATALMIKTIIKVKEVIITK